MRIYHRAKGKVQHIFFPTSFCDRGKMHQLIRCLLLCACMWCNASSFAQQTCHAVLEGFVLDAHDKTALPFAGVYIEELKLSCTCDEKGGYRFTGLCQGTYTLKVVHLNCEPLTQIITVNGNTVHHFYPEHHTEQLRGIEVRDLRNADKLLLPETELSGEKLRQTRGQTLGESLRSIPGVNTLQTGNSIAKPVIHGMHSQRLLILNNGIRQEGQQWGAEHAPEIDPLIADKLKVVKGAGSVRYGSDAMAGVILVEPRALRDSAGVAGEVLMVGASNGRSGTASAFLEGNHKRIKAFSWRVQGTLKKAGSLSAPTYTLANTGLTEYNFSYALGWKKKFYGAEVFYSQFNTKLGILGPSHTGNLSDLQRALQSEVPAETGKFTYQINRPYQHAGHELFTARAWLHDGASGKWLLQYGRQYNLRYEYDKHRPLSDSLAGLNHPELQFELSTHTADLTYEHGFLKHGRGCAGISIITQTNTYEGRALIPNFRNRGIGVFWMEKYPMGDFVAEAGLRYDYRKLEVFRNVRLPGGGNTIEQSLHPFQNFSGNAGLLYRPDSTLQLSLHAGTAWRPPSVNELYSFGLHHGAAAIEYGNDSLGSERTLNGIFALRYAPFPALLLDANAYVHSISNFIYRKPTMQPVLTIRGAFPGFQYTQTNALLRGCDVSAAWNLLPHVQLGAKASWLRATDQHADNWLIMMPSDRYEGNFTYRFKPFAHLHDVYLTASWLYVTRQWRVPLNSDFAEPPAAYHLLNLHMAGFVFLWNRNIELGFSVFNAGNTRYRDYLDRFRYFADAMGRNYTLRMGIPLQTQ